MMIINRVGDKPPKHQYKIHFLLTHRAGKREFVTITLYADRLVPAEAQMAAETFTMMIHTEMPYTGFPSCELIWVRRVRWWHKLLGI